MSRVRGCNHQSTSTISYNFYVQLPWYRCPDTNFILARRDEGSGKPCPVIEASILAPTLDLNQGGNHCAATAEKPDIKVTRAMNVQ